MSLAAIVSSPKRAPRRDPVAADKGESSGDRYLTPYILVIAIWTRSLLFDI
jgi:hypothetical protein